MSIDKNNILDKVQKLKLNMQKQKTKKFFT